VDAVVFAFLSHGARDTAPPVMKIKLTLVCECCNKGLSYAECMREVLKAWGYDVEVCSRNLHGREPKDAGLDIGRTALQIKENPTILLEAENLRVVGNAFGFEIPMELRGV
jgi:hypothetical protein